MRFFKHNEKRRRGNRANLPSRINKRRSLFSETLEQRWMLDATIISDTNLYPPESTPAANPANTLLTTVPFNESSTIAAGTFPAVGATVNLQTGTLGVFYNDETAMTLGVTQVTVKTTGGTQTFTGQVSPLPSSPSSVTNPLVGVGGGGASSSYQYVPPTSPFDTLPIQPGTDASGRPVFPSLYVTDITGLSPSSLQFYSGDWQDGGTPIAPNAVFGTWKSATETIDETGSTPSVSFSVGANPAKNNWDLGPGADPAPTSFPNQGYGAEAQWNLSSLHLNPGHSYRFYFIVHDGDQNKTGGDVGQAAFDLVAPVTPTLVTSASATGSGVGNTVLSDSATISGGNSPTGTVTFTVTQPDGTTIPVGNPVNISGDGTYNAPTTVLATEVGTYTFHASYSGDSHNSSTVDNGQNESVTVGKVTPTISTNASQSAGAAGSAVLSDSVTVSGGNHPTGTVTFTLTQPDGTTVAVGAPVTINGDGTYNASSTIAATQAGTYTFHASYSGDSLNNGAVDNGQNESLTVGKATPTITTNASQSAGAVGSAVLSDSVTVSGGSHPTGTVTFTLTQPDGTTIPVGNPVNISGDGTYSAPTTVLASEVGTYTFHAGYSGDSLNNGAVDNGQNESVSVGKATPMITTNASQTAGAAGSAVLSDSVTVSGGNHPTGTVTFTLSQPDGTTVVVGAPVMINGDGTYNASTTVLASEVGTYTFHASYSGDSLNNGAVDNGQNESVSVGKATPMITTNASQSAGAAGSAVLSDSVTVSGGVHPTGTVTFTLSQPDGTTVVVGAPVTISGDGTYNAATTIVATQAGTYTFHASYSGDSLNNGAVDNGQNESVTVGKATPTITTNASQSAGAVGSAVLSDSVTVSGGSHPTGTVMFTLTQPDGTTIPVGNPVNISGDGTYSAPTTVLATEVGTYTFHASYSGDSLNNGAVDNGQNESVSVGKATPMIATNASQTTAAAGSAVLSDSVTVSGGNHPTGTVTFTLSQPDGTTVVVGAPVTINGDGTYNASSTVLATQVGTYTFHANYSGDALNNGAVDNGQNESLSISPSNTQVIVFKVADQQQINAGDTAGFTIKIQNVGPSTAQGLTLTDPLPAGVASDVNWQIDTTGIGIGAGTQPADFVITGPVGHQTLSLISAVNTLPVGGILSVHLTGQTSLNDVDPNLPPCTTTLVNTATVNAANEPPADQNAQATATVTLHNVDVDVSKEFDNQNGTHIAGQQVGFVLQVYNQGCITAQGVTLSDPLPAGSGGDISWRIDTSVDSPQDFQITGPVGQQVLSLAPGLTTLAPGATMIVHVIGQTTVRDQGNLNNLARVNATNEPPFEQNSQADSGINIVAPQGNPFEIYVESVFQQVLGRQPNAFELAQYANGLANGSITRVAFTEGLTHSAEYFDDLIQRTYEHYLGRAADSSGLLSWQQALQAGLTDEQLEASFIGSPEYYQHSGGTDRAWVDHMYFDLLGRAPDAQGEVFWVSALANGQSRSSVAIGFAASAEREGMTVQSDYQSFLGRSASQSEVNGWVQAFEQGMRNEDVIAGFAASDEYFGEHS